MATLSGSQFVQFRQLHNLQDSAWNKL